MTITLARSGKGAAINLPALLETRLLVQASSGGGKSWCLRRLLEQTAPLVQQLVIDPEGEFSTLREKFDYVICAPRDGDAIATPATAALLARRLLETGVSAILDIYELKAHDRQAFVKRFLEAMVNSPKTLWKSVMIVLDEAHVFAPQSGSADALQSVIDIATRGRKRGFALCCATQRLSKLHKDVAAELGNKLIGRTGLDVDVKRAADELGMNAKEAIIALRNLTPGHFFAFGPALTQSVEVVKIGSVVTTHPRSGQRMLSAPPAPSAKVLKSLAALADLPKQAAAELQTEQDLRAELSRARAALTRAEKDSEAAGVSNAEMERMCQRVRDEEAVKRSELQAHCDNAYKALWDIRDLANVGLNRIPNPEDRAKLVSKIRAASPPQSKPEIQARAKRNDGSIPTGERAILIACFQHLSAGCSREQLTVLTGYKRSTRDAYIQRLRERGMIELLNGQVFATGAGKAEIGTDYEPLPTGPELRDYWFAKLPAGESKILQIVCSDYPRATGRELIGEQTGFARSSRDAYLQRLKSRQLIQVIGRGEIRASDILF